MEPMPSEAKDIVEQSSDHDGVFSFKSEEAEEWY